MFSHGRMTYKELKVWQRAMDAVVDCYRLTASFPRYELYGLTSQVRRAAVSIPSNVAEGHCRRSMKAYMNHVSIGLGSSGELQTCIEVAQRLAFVTPAAARVVLEANDEIGRMLYGLYNSLEARIAGEESAKRGRGDL
jgi:four helix bundle protein